MPNKSKPKNPPAAKGKKTTIMAIAMTQKPKGKGGKSK